MFHETKLPSAANAINMSKFRTERLGLLIQEKISTLILEGRIKDNRVNSFLSITRVNVSGDLSYADIYVSNISNVEKIEKGVAGLQSAAGFIQSQLGAVMHVRRIPHLRFHADLSISQGFDLVKKIDELSKESKEMEEKESTNDT